MNLFGSKKEIYVSSVTYNLLGDDKPRNLVKDMYLNALLNPPPDMAEYILSSALNGLANNFINYMKWSIRSDYVNRIGLATSDYIDASLLKKEEAEPLLQEYLNWPVDKLMELESVIFGSYNYMYFANDWVIKNRPDQWGTEFTVEEYTYIKDYRYEWEWIEDGYGDAGGHYGYVRYPVYDYAVRITFEDGSTVSQTFDTVDKNARYIYFIYYRKIHISNPDGSTSTVLEPYSLIYKEGSGYKPFDDIFKDIVKQGYTYPAFIPLRTWKTFVSDKYLPEIHKMNFKAVEKSLGKKDYYTELMDNIADNRSIGDIDFAYLFFGIPMNTPSREGRKYIFNLLKNFFLSGEITRGFFSKRFWRNPKHIRIWSKFGSINYDVWLEWGGLDNEIRAGVFTDSRTGKPLKKGDYWIGVSWETEEEIDSEGNLSKVTLERTRMVYQMSDKRHRILDVFNFAHGNYVYGGKSVIVSGEDVNFSEDADPSEFVIPLQMNTLKAMPKMQANQIMQLANNVMFNCYKVVKKKWYQTGIFQIIVIVVAIIITIVSWGSASGVSAGMVSGTIGGSVATAAGLVGLQYLIVANVVNVIASMIITRIISIAATALFGEKIGAIVGFIASIVAVSYINAGSLAGMQEALTSMFTTPMGLLNLTSSVLNLATQFTQFKIQDIMEQMKSFSAYHEERMDEVEKAYKDLIGDSVLNPDFFWNLMASSTKLAVEPMERFLTRTLLVGSDIVDYTLNQVYDFTRTNLQLKYTN